MDHSHYERMVASFPKSRVDIDKTRWMRRKGVNYYIAFAGLGALAFYVFGSERIFYPYAYNPKKIVYKADPDYVNGTIVFYQKEVNNVIENL